jgi:uncharacterized membrane protein
MSDNQVNWTRFRYALSGFAFILIPFLSIDFISYKNTAAIVNGWILVIIGFFLLLYFSSLFKNEKIVNYLTYLGLILSIVEIFFVVSTIFPNAYTDEIIIQYYSAKIFMEGKDPYMNSNMVNVFKNIKPNPIYVTPQLNGGIVDYLLYPGMSVIAFLPAAYFGLPDYTDLFVVTALLYAVVILYARKKNVLDSFPFLSLMLALDIGFFGFSVGGSTDVLWVFFLVLAYVYKDKPGWSGIFYGLSLSSKQISIIMLPFLMYYVFREKGNSWKKMALFVASTLLSFFLTNLPFILMGYHQWLRNIIEAEFQPVIGIGVGFSEVAFSGVVNIPSRVFTVLFLMTISIMFVIYVRFYGKLKYAFFSFPVLIFLFNYRVLMGYVIDWAMLIILTYVDYVSQSSDEMKNGLSPGLIADEISRARKKLSSALSGLVKSNTKVILVVLVIFFAGIGGIIYAQDTSPPTNIFVINSVTNMSSPQQIPGVITSMDVNISYNPAEGMPVESPIFFRIITNNATYGNYNGLIWKTNTTLSPGANNVQIEPLSSVDIITNSTTIGIQAYYKFQSRFYTTMTNYSSSIMGFSNYKMDFPQYSKTNPYVSWAFTSTLPKDNFTYISVNGKQIFTNGFNMSLVTPKPVGSISFENNTAYIEDPYVNLSYLATGNYIMNFSYSISGNGTTYEQIVARNYTEIHGINFTAPDGSSVFLILARTGSGGVYMINGNYYVFERNGTINFLQVYNLLKLGDSNLSDVSAMYFTTMNTSGYSYFSAWNFKLLKA